MAFRDRQTLKETARQRLAGAAFDPQKLMLVYVGVSSLAMLLVTGLNFLLTEQIAGTGGLSGLGMRSVLETAVQVLQLAANLVMPFWTMGYLSCVLKIVRGQSFGLQDLLTGFRHFAPALRLNFLYSLQFLLLAFLCLYPSMLLYSVTPLAAPVMEILEPLAQSGAAEIVLDDATLAQVTEAMWPMYVIYIAVFLAVAAPRFYNYRMAFYALLDYPAAGARAALRRSTLMMRGRRLDLLKLDASFWWFYVLDGLTLVLCYGDTVLSMLGVQLPVSADAAYFLFYVLYLAAQLGLYVWARNRVECTYAAGYDALSREELEMQ